MAEMFFHHYDDVFGSSPLPQHISAATIAVYHAGAQMQDEHAQAHHIMGHALLTLARERYQRVEEEEEKRQRE